MNYTQTGPRTGSERSSVRYGFGDYDVFGPGNVVGMTGGFLDAPTETPSGGSTVLPGIGSIARASMMQDATSTHACTFKLCTCGGNGKTVHVRNA